MSCFILRCDIDGFVEVVNHLFPLVAFSFSECLHLCNSPFLYLLLPLHPDTLWLSLSLTSCTTHLTLFFFVCFPSLAGAKGLQFPSLSLFLSFPTSLFRPQGPRRFCSKWFVRAGPTAWSVEQHWHSAKACSMRCTKHEVNNALQYIIWSTLSLQTLQHDNPFSWISDTKVNWLMWVILC